MEAQHRHPAHLRPVRTLMVIAFTGFIGWTLRAMAVLFGVPADWQWASTLFALAVVFLLVSLTFPWWWRRYPLDSKPDDSQRPGGD